ncbi:MAG: ImuA family protein [Planctomycetota bacterium]
MPTAQRPGGARLSACGGWGNDDSRFPIESPISEEMGHPPMLFTEHVEPAPTNDLSLRKHAGACGLSMPPTDNATKTVRKLRAKLESYDHRRAKRAGWTQRFIPTGLAPLDAVLPHGGLPCGAVVEILSDGPGVGAMSLAMRIAAQCYQAGSIPPATNEGSQQVSSTRSGDLEGSRLRSPEGTADISPWRQPWDGNRQTNQAPVGATESCVVAASAAPRSLLKKGTGTSPGALLGGVIGHELGASPLFQQYCILLDTLGDFYPPAAWQYGIALDRLIVLRTRNVRDAFWAMDQSLRCFAVAAVIAPFTQLDERHSRRLQLAARSSGCIGLILKPARQRVKSFAAVQMLLGGSPTSPRAPSSATGGRLGMATPNGAQSLSDPYLCRITLLAVREGTPAEPVWVDLHHEAGIGYPHPVPVDRSAAKIA